MKRKAQLQESRIAKDVPHWTDQLEYTVPYSRPIKKRYPSSVLTSKTCGLGTWSFAPSILVWLHRPKGKLAGGFYCTKDKMGKGKSEILTAFKA